MHTLERWRSVLQQAFDVLPMAPPPAPSCALLVSPVHLAAALLQSVKHEEEEGGQELEPQEVDRKASDSAVPVKASTASTDVAPPTGDRSVVGRHLRRPSAPHPGAPPEMVRAAVGRHGCSVLPMQYSTASRLLVEP